MLTTPVSLQDVVKVLIDMVEKQLQRTAQLFHPDHPFSSSHQ